MDNGQLARMVALRASALMFEKTGRIYVPAAASARHVHLCQQDLEQLFGKGYTLRVLKTLSQPGQFAAHEQVTVVGPKGKIEHIRVLGPVRPQTQIEISLTDSFALGIRPPVRMSGDVAQTPGCRLIGPAGELTLPQGVIAAARHLHLSAQQALLFGLADKQVVTVRTEGVRGVSLHQVVVRTGPGHDMELHLDTDEANAIALTPGQMLEVLRTR